MAADALDYDFEARYYTYADRLEFDESVRAELIGGVLYMMAPPATNHQDVHRELFGRLFVFLQGKPRGVYSKVWFNTLEPKVRRTFGSRLPRFKQHTAFKNLVLNQTV